MQILSALAARSSAVDAEEEEDDEEERASVFFYTASSLPTLVAWQLCFSYRSSLLSTGLCFTDQGVRAEVAARLGGHCHLLFLFNHFSMFVLLLSNDSCFPAWFRLIIYEVADQLQLWQTARPLGTWLFIESYIALTAPCVSMPSLSDVNGALVTSWCKCKRWRSQLFLISSLYYIKISWAVSLIHGGVTRLFVLLAFLSFW